MPNLPGIMVVLTSRSKEIVNNQKICFFEKGKVLKGTGSVFFIYLGSRFGSVKNFPDPQHWLGYNKTKSHPSFRPFLVFLECS